MKSGYLSEYFVGVMAKRLSAVEVRPEKSNQHEFNGVIQLKKLLGKNRITLTALFLWLGDEDEISELSSVTWYDARENDKTRSEFRLYYQSNSVMRNKAKEGDLVIIARKRSGDLMILVASKESLGESRLMWLFDISAIEVSNYFSIQHIENLSDKGVENVTNFILQKIGLPERIVSPDDQFDQELFDELISKYKNKFPPTAKLSSIARQTLSNVNAIDDPDNALQAWLANEERLFRHIEEKIISIRLDEGFHDESSTRVDEFIKYSLSVQNRRKSRAGHALENHLDEIFRRFELRYERQAKTEFKSRPDFLFPGSTEYKDKFFPESLLSMLGVKSTCKERWRQVLAEAKRIHKKHLLTLEPGISENQTDEMARNNLQLVLPAGLHITYSEAQQKWLMSLHDFIRHVISQQKL